MCKKQFGENAVGRFQFRHDQRSTQSYECCWNIKRHQIDRRGCAEQFEGLAIHRRVIANHHVRLKNDPEGERDHHPDPHAGRKEPRGTRKCEQIGPFCGNVPPQFQRTAEKFEGEQKGSRPDSDIHPDPLKYIGPVDCTQSPDHKVYDRNDQHDDNADLEWDTPTGGHIHDVTESDRLHLNVENGERHGDDSNRYAHCFRLVKVSEHIRRRNVSERFAKRPDAGTEYVGDGPNKHRPRPGSPETDPVRKEETS